MDTHESSRRYTQDQVNAILRRALEKQNGAGTLTHQELIDTAQELGLDPEQVELAITEQEVVGELDAAREEWKRRRRQKFKEHLRSYAIVNGILMILSLANGDFWFLWPLLGWGIGLAFDAADTFWPKEEKMERGARRLIQRRDRMARRQGMGRKGLVIDSKSGKIIIEKGDKYIEIG